MAFLGPNRNSGFFGGDPIGPAGTPGNRSTPFLWGSGGRRMSRDDIELERRLAAQQMAAGADYSPVGHWTQGLARVAQGLAGGFRMREADQAQAEAEVTAAEQDVAQRAVLEALMAGGQTDGGGDPVAAALLDPELRDIGMAVFKARQPKSVEPSIQRTNSGDILGINPMTGEVVFNIADPNPKPVIDWQKVTDPLTGAVEFIPFGPNGPIMQGGGDPTSGAAPGGTPPATLPPDFGFDEGDAGSNASGRFR